MKIEKILNKIMGARMGGDNPVLQRLEEVGFVDHNETEPMTDYRILQRRNVTVVYDYRTDKIIDWYKSKNNIEVEE
jgi:hypothetical protein